MIQLAKLRRRAGYSREKFASALDCSTAQVRNWETGRSRRPYPRLEKALCDFFDVDDVERLFEPINDNSPSAVSAEAVV